MPDPYFNVSSTERDAIHWFYRALGGGLALLGLGLVLLDLWLLGQGTLFRLASGLLVPVGALVFLAGRMPADDPAD